MIYVVTKYDALGRFENHPVCFYTSEKKAMTHADRLNMDAIMASSETSDRYSVFGVPSGPEFHQDRRHGAADSNSSTSDRQVIQRFIDDRMATHGTSCLAMARLLDGTHDDDDVRRLGWFVARRAEEFPITSRAIKVRAEWRLKMTVSTDAILFYGYCWVEETRRPWLIGKTHEHGTDDDEGEWEWEARYARAHGVLPSELPFPSRTDPRGHAPTDYTPPEQAIGDAYYAYWDQRRELAESSPCQVSSHCSNDFPMPYVAVKASWMCSSRGSMTKVNNLSVDPAWDGQLARFCEILGIRTDNIQPAWWLVSDWS